MAGQSQSSEAAKRAAKRIADGIVVFDKPDWGFVGHSRWQTAKGKLLAIAAIIDEELAREKDAK